GAAPPQVAARELAGERRVLPLPARRDDIHMALKKQRRALAPPAQPREEVRAAGLLGEDANLHAEPLEQPLGPRDALALASGRVGRVEAEQLREQLRGLFVELLGSHRRSVAARPSGRS